MPPEIKDAIVSLDLRDDLKSKYQLLTCPSHNEQVQKTQNKVSITIPEVIISPFPISPKSQTDDYITASHVQTSSSYWDWEEPSPQEEKEQIISQILRDENARLAVSSDAITATLLSAKNSKSVMKETVYENNEEKESESYWDEPSEDDSDLFSSAKIEKMLIEDANRRTYENNQSSFSIVAPHVEDSSHPNHSYWDWPSEPLNAQEKRRQMIEKILQEENIRQLLSAEHIVSQESTINSAASDDIEQERNIDVNSSYWEWASEHEDIVNASHLNDTTHPNHAYWDFPSKPITSAEVKKQVIDKILEDERIREVLCSSTVKKREITFMQTVRTSASDVVENPHSSVEYWNWSGQKNERERTITAPHADDQSHPNHAYWDHPSDPICKEETKAEIIQRILKEEAIRKSLSSFNTVETLMRDRNGDAVEVIDSNNDSGSYWDW